MTGSRSHLAQSNGIFFFLIAWLITAAGPCSKDLAGPIAPSEWGGEHIGLTVSTTGGALEYDCASGTIDQKIAANTDGTFTAIGTHTRGHGGPIMQGEVPDRHPARYDGWTDGETMKLTVTLIDAGQKLGDFALIRGQSPRVVRCL
ncbi:MAG: hypothetical protein M3Z54_14030 [Gemmatimonadota bacterium]|nr:hypothetical protein [Gemmatimonadota bacterium]